jgi:hypothetical protein
MFRRRLNRHTNRRGGTDPASSIVRRGATDDQQREAVERIAKTQDSLRAVLRRCIEDAKFRSIFAHDEAIKRRWPVLV